ncbi:MAG: LCP family protein [Anaerovoracaceae bacterium]|jgi:LCP family protein required for cell wall assembly
MKDTFDRTRIKNDDRTLNKETIRKYEDPDYKRAAEEYERLAKYNRKLYQQERKEKQNAGKAAAGMAADAARRAGNTAKSAGRRAVHHAKSLKQAEKDQRRREKRGANRRRREEPAYENRAYEYGTPEAAAVSRSRRGRHTRWNKKKVIRNIIVLLLVLFLVFVVYFCSVVSHFDKVKTSSDQFAIDPQVARDLSGYRDIAILGVDARKGEPLDGSRTDAIIIMRIKKINGDIQLISIMRDSYLKMKDSDNKLILDKITHAHHYGGGVDTCAALNRSLDLNIREFVIFNWQAVADTVDDLGGIEVDVKKNEIRDLNKWGPETAYNVGGTYEKITTTGKQTIDGVQATTYCRIRKTSGGDTGRGDRYKKVMSAVLKKIATSPGSLNKLATNVFPDIRTNMGQAAMLTAVLRAPGYQIDASYGWPKDYYGGLLGNGIWYAVPQTLSTNVKWLHKKAFDQDDYQPSDTCEEISNEIRYYTGI